MPPTRWRSGQDRHRHRRCAGSHRDRCPPPQGDPDAPLKALLVDSWYDAYLGVIVLVRVIDGKLKKGMKVRMMGTGASYEVDKVACSRPS
jgi:GTP-binding protein LepA